MLEEGIVGQPIRFLPVAWVPPDLRAELEPALRQAADLVEVHAYASSPSVARRLRHVAAELSRYGGPQEAPCLLSKATVFELSDELDRIAEVLRRSGLVAAALVAVAVGERLLEAIVEVQPMAPA